MIGGIDKIEMAKGKAAILDEMRKKIPTLIKEGGYIPGIDHSIGSDISLENAVFYMETLKEMYGVK